MNDTLGGMNPSCSDRTREREREIERQTRQTEWYIEGKLGCQDGKREKEKGREGHQGMTQKTDTKRNEKGEGFSSPYAASSSSSNRAPTATASRQRASWEVARDDYLWISQRHRATFLTFHWTQQRGHCHVSQTKGTFWASDANLKGDSEGCQHRSKRGSKRAAHTLPDAERPQRQEIKTSHREKELENRH